MKDDCGFTAFDYECDRAFERILRTRSIYGEDERVLEALEDEPEIKEIMEEI